MDEQVHLIQARGQAETKTSKVLHERFHNVTSYRTVPILHPASEVRMILPLKRSLDSQ
jgi:hypothetical protein